MVEMHFYIPPDVLLIGGFTGKVMEAVPNDINCSGGLYLKFTDHSNDELRRLEEFFGRKRHLIDKNV